MKNKAAKLASGGVIASLAALTVAGCGGTSSHTTTGTVTQQARQVTIASPDVGAAPGQSEQTSGHVGKQPAATTGRHARKQSARYPSGPDDENNGTGAKPLDPCALVSAAELQGIAHRAVVERISAPLGPTCIYRLRGARADITLAVQSAGFKQLVRQMKHSKRVTIHGRTGYCGKLGRPTLYLSVGPGRVLSVSTSCSLTVPIADKALARLKA